MSVAEESEVKKRCFKIKERLMESLNIVYNDTNSKFLLWNKYQLFIYENHNFQFPAKVFIPEFQVRQVIHSNNYLVCLDMIGNIHIISLKFKNSAQKRLKSSFLPKEHGIVTCARYSTEQVLALKYETDKYLLSLHQINADFELEMKVAIRLDNELWPSFTTSEKCILFSHAITRQNLDLAKELFGLKQCYAKVLSIVLVSFDKTTVYGCLLAPKMLEKEILLVKLYTSPSEICDIKIIETDSIDLVIALTIGTVIKFSLPSTQPAQKVHLNTAVYKIIASKSNDAIIYTDGVTMWKTEYTFTENKINFYQFFPKLVKDFVKFGDCLLCTSYNNIIYIFNIEDVLSYSKVFTTEQYVSAQTVLNNSECFYQILKEVQKGHELSQSLNQESSYLTALALSKRQDIMNQVIQSKVIVYDNYEDAIAEQPDIILTEKISRYFETESFFFLIHITATIIHNCLDDILSHLFGDIKIHINLCSEQNILKTTSVKLNRTLENLQVLIPLNTAKMINTNQIRVNIKLATNIPGAFDEKQTIWTVLYRKNYVLNSEHFIKININNRNNSLKEPDETIDELILKAASKQHGDIFDFNDVTKVKDKVPEWAMYVKLPPDYIEIFNTADYSKEHFNSKKASFLLQQFTSEDFLISNTELELETPCGKVKIVIIDELARLVLKVSSENIKLAYDIRNFLADLIYSNFDDYKPDVDYVHNSLYTVMENLKNPAKELIENGTNEQFKALIDRFQKSVITALPL